jgi:hypothetical protein
VIDHQGLAQGANGVPDALAPDFPREVVSTSARETAKKRGARSARIGVGRSGERTVFGARDIRRLAYIGVSTLRHHEPQLDTPSHTREASPKRRHTRLDRRHGRRVVSEGLSEPNGEWRFARIHSGCTDQVVGLHAVHRW